MTTIRRSIFLQLSALLMAIAVLGFSVHAVQAGPYDGLEARPGDTILNAMTVRWHDEGARGSEISVTDEITLEAIQTPMTLTLKQHSPDGAPTTVSRSLHSTSTDAGPFRMMDLPRDRAGNAVPLDRPIPLADTDRIRAGETVFLFLDNAGLNQSSQNIDQVVLKLVDSSTGDTEFLTLFETSPDTGLFSGYVFTQRQQPVSGSTHLAATSLLPDGVLITNPRAIIEATFTDPWNNLRRLSREVLVGPVDPYGLVFDSRSGAPVDGVNITLIDDATGKPARVYGDDLIATYPSTVITGSRVTDSSGRIYDLAPGEYRFPFVDLGRYRLAVSPPESLVAPSEVEDIDLQALPGAPFALGPGSGLQPFDVMTGPATRVDIPLDGAGFLIVTRTGSADELETGDFIEFTVTARSDDPNGALGSITDRLPSGLRLLPDTILIDGATPAREPEISATGREIVFSDLTFWQDRDLIITYVAQVTPVARDGDVLVSSSLARAARKMSNEASHALEVLAAFGRDEDILLGQVIAQSCDDPVQQDIDLSGIRLLLEDGRQVLTDPDGRFVFRRIARGGHVVGIDPLSLPAGYEPVLCEGSTASAGSALTRFIDAKGGLARQITFTIRPARITDHPDPIAPPYQSAAHLDADWLETQSQTSGLVYPAQGHLPRGRSSDIAAIRPSGGKLTLEMNGKIVPDLHRAPVIRGEARDLLIWKGVALQDGINTVRLVTEGADGEVMSDETRQILFNSKIRRMNLVEEASILSSDGRTRPVVVFKITDDAGIPLHPGTIITLRVASPFAFSETIETDGMISTRRSETASGTIDADGLLRLRMAPVHQPGTARFHVQSDKGDVSASAWMASEGRPFLLVGLAAGTAAQRSISDHMAPPGEAALGEVGQINLHGRIALFAQGVVKGKWLLTARYDSALTRTEGDFFDIDPEADYIVYGDRSQEGNAASSRHPLYLRLESDRTELLYGDFDTAITQGVATYTRRLTGARALFGNDMISVTAFAARSSQSFVEDVFAADGTTGPFDLTGDDILTFSETVLIETTSRIDPARILQVEELVRGRDYDINYRTGRIFLSRPLLSRSADLNLNALVVRYEVETEADDGLILGGWIEAEVSERVSVGSTFIHEDNIAGSSSAGRMFGADLTWAVTHEMSAALSLGLSEQDASNTLPHGADGHSGRLGLTWVREEAALEAWIQHQSTDFDIANQLGTSENIVTTGLTARFPIGEAASDDDETAEVRHLEASLQSEQNMSTQSVKHSAEVLRFRAQPGIERGFGLRREHLATDDQDGSKIKAIGLVKHQSEDGRLRLSLGQEVTLARRGAINAPDIGSLEAEYDLTDRLAMRLTNEVAVDRDLHVSIFGLSADYRILKNTTLSAGAFNAAGTQGDLSVAHAGISQEIEIDADTRLRLSWDQQAPIAGDFANTSPLRDAGLSNPRIDEGYRALSLGLEHKGDTWTSSALIEHREADSGVQGRIRATVSRDLNADLAMGGKISFFEEVPDFGSTLSEHEAQISAAWRPREASFIVLDRLRARYDREGGRHQLRVTNSLYYTRLLAAGHQLNLRHGIKYARFDFPGSSHADILNMAAGEYRHQLTSWSDIGLHGALLHSMDSGSFEHALGLSVGLTPFENGWLSLGYNWSGFHDAEFSEDGFTDQGAFIQFRIKLDQNSLAALTQH